MQRTEEAKRGLLPDIKGFQEITLIDWEGKVASLIFLAGCNFRCGFCHSSRLATSPEGLDSVSFGEISSFLKRKKGWVDGVVITGGEPTLWDERLVALISEIKDRGLSVKLDTNGTRPNTLERLIDADMLDYISMDIKAPLHKERYDKAAGIEVILEDIIRSKNLILGCGIGYEFRTTAVPGIVSLSDIRDIARSIIPAKRYCIQQFRPREPIDPSFLHVSPYSEETLRSMADAASEFLPCVVVKNVVI